MNRLDRAVIAGLVLVVAIAAIAIGGPALLPKPTGELGHPVARRGDADGRTAKAILGRPTSVNPLAARTRRTAISSPSSSRVS